MRKSEITALIYYLISIKQIFCSQKAKIQRPPATRIPQEIILHFRGRIAAGQNSRMKITKFSETSSSFSCERIRIPAI